MAIKDFEFSTKYTVDQAGRISTKGDVLLIIKCTSLSERFKSVGGGFYCDSNILTSLEGAPQSVGGSFSCGFNKLTSLEGAPQSVGGWFDCCNNLLTSLEHAPQSVGGYFDCHNNKLTSLSGAPQSVGGWFDCDWIKDLPMLDLLKYKNVYISKNDLVNKIFKKYCGNYNKQNVMGCIRDYMRPDWLLMRDFSNGN